MKTKHVHLSLLLVVFAASGAAALVYEVLWLKELGRLFGVTAYATATTLGVFFLGLALGGLVWGKRAESVKNPLRTYAQLEVGIAASAVLYLLLFDLYRGLQSSIFGAIGYAPALLLAVKFLMAAGILLLPSFFMGGTLPIMAQYVVRRRDQLGSRTTLLYATNTIGAALGALSAGFLLPPALGFKGAYLTAILLNLTVALIAWLWREREPSDGRPASKQKPVPVQDSVSRAKLRDETMASLATIIAISVASGFITLSLEVVWTRMFSQVLQNSVYTFSIILGVFLIFLALGSAIAHYLCRRNTPPRFTLFLLLVASGISVILSPVIFAPISGSLDYLKSNLSFWPYVGLVFLGVAAAIGPALIAMGTVFPYLMKLSEWLPIGAGRTVGRLVATNTIAAIFGSLLAGFVLLDLFGVWGSIRVLALLYLVVALLVLPWRQRGSIGLIVAAASLAAIVAVSATYKDYSQLWLDEVDGERLVEAWEGAAGSVAVVQTPDQNLRIRINGTYNLGGSASAVNERLQGQLPFFIHSEARSVFFLGLGTGITASGALSFPVDRVVVCEVNRDVINASRKHFGPWLRELFENPRVQVLPEDGRTWLAATHERFDAIVGDIFLSYKSDVGSLYTREQFQAVKQHLNHDGVFVQWITFFDTSQPEFEIIAKTMLEVFPSVTLWRRSFSPRFPVYALVGRLDEAPLDLQQLRNGIDMLKQDPELPENTWIFGLPLAAYVTNLSLQSEELESVQINTDNRTLLEYMAPITERNSRGARETSVLAWYALLNYLEATVAKHPPEDDPFLKGIPPEMTRQVRAGVAYYGYSVYNSDGKQASAQRYLAEYQKWIASPDSP